MEHDFVTVIKKWRNAIYDWNIFKNETYNEKA